MDMNSKTFILCFFFVLFLFVYIIEYIYDYRKIKKKKTDKIMIMSYVIKKFNLDKNKINYKKELKWMSLINGFIIAGVSTVVSSIDTYIILQLGIGFVLLFLLIYALYELYGRHLKKLQLQRRDKK